MSSTEIDALLEQLKRKQELLEEKEKALADQQEEFVSQREELTSVVDELGRQNEYLLSTLNNLKKRNDELDQILYRASHDLKTPVSSIWGLVSIFKSETSSPQQATALLHLIEKTNQMQGVIDSLSNLSIAFFNPVVKKKYCSVNAMIDSSWKTLTSTRNLHLKLPDEDVDCYTDPILLKILFSTLLTNAALYRNEDKPGYVLVKTSKGESGVLIDIQDDGDGIPKEIRSRIFEMFYRGSERSKGSGLGLYIAKHIVERLAGQLTLLDETHTTFRVMLNEKYEQ